MTEMILYWIENSQGPTWNVLADALENIGYKSSASSIQSTYTANNTLICVLVCVCTYDAYSCNDVGVVLQTEFKRVLKRIDERKMKLLDPFWCSKFVEYPFSSSQAKTEEAQISIVE